MRPTLRLILRHAHDRAERLRQGPPPPDRPRVSPRLAGELARARRLLALLDASRDDRLLERWPQLARLAAPAHAWARATLEAQLRLPGHARHGELIDLLTAALKEHNEVKSAA